MLPEMDDRKGTSLVLIRTQKGVKLFDSIRNCIICNPATYEAAVKDNIAEYLSVPMPWQRRLFFKDMNKMSFNDLEKKYLRIPLKKKIKNTIKKIIRGGGRI